MIDASLRLLDKLIELLNMRQKNKERYFAAVVEPMFQDAELIVKDYVTLFGDLIAKLEKGRNVSEVTRWIEERRLSLLPVRIKTRTLLEEGGIGQSQQMSTFEQGIWGLLKGGLSLVEEGHAPLTEYGFGGHTVLDLLRRCSREPLARRRGLLLRCAEAQLACIQAAWKNTVRGYAEIRNKSHAKA
jgi:hypothetical protein